MSTQSEQKRRLRGVVLELLQQNHERQRPRHSDYTLMAAMDRLSYEIYLDLVRELLQDLADRGYVKLDELRNEKTGEVSMRRIQITPLGKNLVEGIAKDQAVLVRLD